MNEGILDYCNDNYKYKRKSILDHINSLLNVKEKSILLLRLEGYSYADIGDYYNLSRERIRQIINKCKRRFPNDVREYVYQYIYETYEMTQEQFCKLTNEPHTTYYFLDMVTEKGQLPIIDINRDLKVPKYIKDNFNSLAEVNYMFINGENILKNITAITEYVVKEYCKKTTSAKDLLNIYNSFLYNNGLSDDESLYTCIYTLINIAMDSLNMLYMPGNKIRYYDINSINAKEFIAALNLEKYNDMEISSFLIYKNNKKLMQEYDVQNHYELHNLIKKLPKELLPTTLKIGRNPTLIFGNGNKKKQLIDILQIHGSMSTGELAREFSKKYGFNNASVKGSLRNIISEYYFDGYYVYEPSYLKAVNE